MPCRHSVDFFDACEYKHVSDQPCIYVHSWHAGWHAWWHGWRRWLHRSWIARLTQQPFCQQCLLRMRACPRRPGLSCWVVAPTQSWSQSLIQMLLSGAISSSCKSHHLDLLDKCGNQCFSAGWARKTISKCQPARWLLTLASLRLDPSNSRGLHMYLPSGLIQHLPDVLSIPYCEPAQPPPGTAACLLAVIAGRARCWLLAM